MRRVLIAVLLALLASSSQVGLAAEGGGWPLDGPAEVLLGFGVAYPGPDGSSMTHHGIDLAAEAGARVRVVRGGTVTFAGSVPASGGGTMRAVTIDSGDVRISYLPLNDVSVSAGQQLDAGALIGVVAASGDASSAQPHLHIGARVGSLYVDPAAYLLPPVVAAPKESVPAGEGAAAEAGAPMPATAGSGTAVATGAAAGNPVPVAGTTGATVPAPSTSVAGSVPGVSSAGVAGVAVAGTAGAPSTPMQVAPSPALGETDVGSCASSVNAAGEATAGTIGDGAGAPIERAVSAADSAALSSLAAHDAAHTIDRRTALTPKTVPGIAVAALVASMLGVALLWPVWRSVIPPTPDVGALSKDVAAVVGR